MFKFSVNLSSRVERLRDFCDLESNNLMHIVATAADFVKTKLASGKKPSDQLVHAWLVDNVRWGAYHCPDVATVARTYPTGQQLSRVRRLWDSLRLRCSVGGAITSWIGQRRFS